MMATENIDNHSWRTRPNRVNSDTQLRSAPLSPGCAGPSGLIDKIRVTKKLFAVFSLFLMGCIGIPEDVRPVDNFEIQKYLGKWYEIARLDHSFERGLTHVTANYSLLDDGGVRVLNRGYSAAEDLWKEAEGRAYFVEGSNWGFLKVSFFGPFYGSYIIFGLDHQNYQYSLVCGPNKSFLWILARSPFIKEDIKNTLIEKAASSGFEVSQLIFVDHGESPNPANSAAATSRTAD